MTEPTASIQHLTAEIVAIGGPLASLVSHTQESARQSGGCGDDIPEILGGLIAPTAATLAGEWPAARLDDAAAVLHAACAGICEEIFLVPLPNRSQRRRARRP